MRKIVASLLLVACGVIMAQFAGSGGGTPVPLANGGSGANLSATGGSNQVVKQNSAGGVFTVGTMACGNLSNGAASCSTDTTVATNITTGTLPASVLPTFVVAYPNQQIGQWQSNLNGATIGAGAGTAGNIYTTTNANNFGALGARLTPLSAGGHLGNLRMTFTGTQNVGGTLVCTVYITNGTVASSLTLTVSNSDGAAPSKSDLVNKPAVSAGDRIALGCVNNFGGGVSLGIVDWSFGLYP